MTAGSVICTHTYTKTWWCEWKFTGQSRNPIAVLAFLKKKPQTVPTGEQTHPKGHHTITGGNRARNDPPNVVRFEFALIPVDGSLPLPLDITMTAKEQEDQILVYFSSSVCITCIQPCLRCSLVGDVDITGMGHETNRLGRQERKHEIHDPYRLGLFGENFIIKKVRFELNNAQSHRKETTHPKIRQTSTERERKSYLQCLLRCLMDNCRTFCPLLGQTFVCCIEMG